MIRSLQSMFAQVIFNLNYFKSLLINLKFLAQCFCQFFLIHPHFYSIFCYFDQLRIVFHFDRVTKHRLLNGLLNLLQYYFVFAFPQPAIPSDKGHSPFLTSFISVVVPGILPILILVLRCCQATCRKYKADHVAL